MAAKKSAPGKNPAPDWEAVERDYRVGQLTIAEIARQYGVGESAVRMRAHRNGWTRDRGNEVRTRIRAELVTEDIREDVRDVRSDVRDRTHEDAAVDHAVEVGKSVVRDHRKIIKANWNIQELVGGHLKAYLQPPAQDAPTEVVESWKRSMALLFPGKSDGLANLLNALTSSAQRLITEERKAFNLDEPTEQRDQDQRKATFLETIRSLKQAGEDGAQS